MHQRMRGDICTACHLRNGPRQPSLAAKRDDGIFGAMWQEEMKKARSKVASRVA